MKIIWTREDIEEELSRRIVIHKIPRNRTKKKKVKQKKLIEDYKGKEGYRRYLKSDWWKERKAKYWKYHERKCYCCGDYATTLHHNNYSRLMEELDKDFVPVCDSCHRETHKLINRGEAKLKNAHKILKSKK